MVNLTLLPHCEERFALKSIFNNRGFQIVLFVLATLAASPPAKAVDYIGTVLYKLGPISFDGYQTASAGQVVEANGHALLWTSTGTSIDLNPSGFVYSEASGTNGTQQVGYGDGSATGGYNHALLWSGTAASAVDLNPTGFNSSHAWSVGGGQQVGDGGNHALLWSGTAASAIDLNPSGFTDSGAYGTNGTQQVGYGIATSGNAHGLLWTGTAASRVDLNPSGFDGSVAISTNGNQQVGYGANGANFGALLWSGTAASAVNLDPQARNSVAISTNGSHQVGYIGGADPMATLWSGTAASEVNLQSLLPAGVQWADSEATDIENNGNIYGWAFGTSNDNSAAGYAIEWSPLLRGDFNRDGHVNAGDIALAIAALTDTADYQTLHGLTDPTLFGKVADVNDDGSFTNADLQYLLDILKSGGGSANTVPEPASLILLSVTSLGLLRCFRRSQLASKRSSPASRPFSQIATTNSEELGAGV